MGHINIEIKAKLKSVGKARQILKTYKAEYKGTDHQIDTYFRVEKGRLKLREGNIENHLIHYDRDDAVGPKQSNITLYKTPIDPALKEVLSKALGILVVVDKQREIYFIENVKFHLDRVRSLGTFIEIEARDEEGSIGKEKLSNQCKQYMELFGVKEEDLIACSYSDLLLSRKK